MRDYVYFSARVPMSTVDASISPRQCEDECKAGAGNAGRLSKGM